MKPILTILILLAAATAQAAPGAKVSWTAGTETDLSGYKIYRSDTGTTFTICADVQTSPTASVRWQSEPGDAPVLDTKRRVTGWTDTGLVGGRWYYYAVMAYDRAGNVSLPSRVAVWIPALKEPSNVKGEAIP